MITSDFALIAKPIGAITISGTDARVDSIRISPEPALTVRGNAEAVRCAADQLEAWFAGECFAFDLPLASPLTPRGAALRDAMVAIGYGDTVSYGALACLANSGARAIGRACARNPFPIVVPCHRVTAAGGALGAYSAGAGPVTKQWLLDWERRHMLG